jgi:hypothetical protein
MWSGENMEWRKTSTAKSPDARFQGKIVTTYKKS